jgi:ribosome-associated translation inhibitor RaiA
MSYPLQITFRDMAPSRVFENRIRELAQRLEKFSRHITQCTVVIQRPHQHANQGGLFDVHINVLVPDSLIAIHRAHSVHPSHEDAYAALRDAFSAAKRKLQEYERQRRDHSLPRGTKNAAEHPAAS